MLRTIKSIARSLWNDNPKFKGLQIMTTGFLGAVIGAGTAILGGWIRDIYYSHLPFDVFGTIVLYFGWSLLLFGTIAMFIGIMMHWISIFQYVKKKDKKSA